MGEFAEKVKRGKIPGPRKRTFSLKEWKDAYTSSDSPDEIDTHLFVSAVHIYAKLAAIRAVIETSPLGRLSRRTHVLALIAAANQQFEAMEIQLSENADPSTDEEARITDLLRVHVQHADGNTYSPQRLVDGLLEGIAIPIKAALQGHPVPGFAGWDAVNWGHIHHEINLSILYDQIEEVWDDCVWNGYVVAGKRDSMIVGPLTPEVKRASVAALARKLALGMEATFYAVQAQRLASRLDLPAKLKTVRSVHTAGDQQRIELGGEASASDALVISMLQGLRLRACPAYYDTLLEEAHELLDGATLSQLLDAWLVISQAARRLWESTADRRSQVVDNEAISVMSECVPFLTREALIRAVHDAANIPIEKVQAIIGFLTFRGKDKQQLWTQPLVSVDDETKLHYVCGSTVAPPDLRFALELWMAQLGVRLDRRGRFFEEYLREVVAAAIHTSPLLSEAAGVIPVDYTFKCNDGSFAQMDLLFRVGGSVFVVEAKCILEPVEATSIGTHQAAIAHGVEQAKARVDLIEEHRSEFAADVRQFGWVLPEGFPIHPLVATSTIAGVGVSVDGVPVVDEFILGKFFAGWYEDIGLDPTDFSASTRIRNHFYANAKEAEATAVAYFNRPPQLQQYFDAVQMEEASIPAVYEGDWRGVMFHFEVG